MLRTLPGCLLKLREHAAQEPLCAPLFPKPERVYPAPAETACWAFVAGGMTAIPSFWVPHKIRRFCGERRKE